MTFQTLADGRPTTQISSLRNTATGYDVTLTYGYDNNGNITSVSDGTNVTTYAYDSANQLIRENNQTAGKTWVWTYDDAGNILSRTEYPYTTGELGEPYGIFEYGYTDPEWGDLLTYWDSNTYIYDAIGNPLSDQNWTYTWQNGRELASMTSGATTWSFTYDANGMRKSRSDGTTTYNYLYNGSQLVLMAKGTDVLYFDHATGTVTWTDTTTETSTVYYYVHNLQGDVVAILNSAGTAVVNYTYDAWGNLLATTGSMASTLGTLNPLTYRGYVYDFDTGLYYLQSRYYNPEVGRFINSDTLVATGQGMLGNNMFAYCRNNPVRRRDIPGTTDVDIFDDGDANLLDDDKGISGGKMGNGSSSGGTVTSGHSSAGGGNASSSTPPTAQSSAPNQTTALQSYYPPNDGFAGNAQSVTLQPGTLVQRTGGLGGKFIAPAGTPKPMLSLPYNQLGQPTTILEVQQPVVVSAGQVAPWFGQMGGGVQYLLDFPLIHYVNADVMRVIA